MQRAFLFLLVSGVCLWQAAPSPAQQTGSANKPLEVIELRPNFHVIAGDGANISVESGSDGLVVVDSGSGARSDEVLAAIRKISTAPIRYVIDTSADPDVVGGNARIAAVGDSLIPAAPNGEKIASGASILAYLNVETRMSAPTGKQAPFPVEAWPTETYSNKLKSMLLNHEAIQISLQPAAHTDGDSIVFFRRSDVVAVGNIIDTENFPVIDVGRGGSIQGELDALNRLVDLAVPATPLLGQEPGTYVVPGHGRVLEQSDVVNYRDMVTIIRDVVQDLINKGNTLEQIQAAEPTKGYTSRYGGANRFVEAIYKSLTKRK